MKSCKAVLCGRGFVDDDAMENYKNEPISTLLSKLHDEDAMVRTMAATACKTYIEESEVSSALIKQLICEQALYTRIEISKTLECGSAEVARQLCNYAGTIGKNRYQTLPMRPSKKKSYPLPRDRFARILSKMDFTIIDVVFTSFHTVGIAGKRELMDVIGWQLFYHQTSHKDTYLKQVLAIMEEYQADELIFWKGITCLSAFNEEKVLVFLETIVASTTIELYRMEALRSLDLIAKRTKEYVF